MTAATRTRDAAPAPFPEPVDRWPMIGPPSLAALGLDQAHLDRKAEK